MMTTINILAGPPPHIVLTGESTAVSRIELYDVKAIVWWANSDAVWEYKSYDLVETLRTLTNTDSLGKTAWTIKRTAKVAFNMKDKENTNA